MFAKSYRSANIRPIEKQFLHRSPEIKRYTFCLIKVWRVKVYLSVRVTAWTTTVFYEKSKGEISFKNDATRLSDFVW